MGNLDSIIMNPPKQQEFEIMEHKFIFRETTTADTLSMEIDISEKKDDVPEDPKVIIKGLIEVLAHVTVSIDGVIPESVQETRVWLLRQKPETIFALFEKHSSLAPDAEKVAEEIKK